MYSEKAKALRRCKKLRVDGEQCRAYAKINENFCSLHSYDHRKKKLPKKGAERAVAAKRRAFKRSQTQRHQTCECLAYKFKHRAGSGVCNYPDPPREVYRAGEIERSASDERSESQAERGRVSNKKSDAQSGENKYLRDLGVREDEPPALKEWQERVNRQTAEEQTHYESLMSKIWSGKV